MKSAILLLLVACLLIATPLTAAAYEPTNEAALGLTPIEIKFDVKEEVAALHNAIGEISTHPVNLIERENSSTLLLCMAFYGLALYVAREKNTEPWRADRDYQSRFG